MILLYTWNIYHFFFIARFEPGVLCLAGDSMVSCSYFLQDGVISFMTQLNAKGQRTFCFCKC